MQWTEMSIVVSGDRGPSLCRMHPSSGTCNINLPSVAGQWVETLQHTIEKLISMQLEKRMLLSIGQLSGHIVLRSELAGMGSSSQVTVALRVLQEKGLLLRIGIGVYAKTRKSSVTGAVIPAGSLETLVIETLEKLGVNVKVSKAAEAYNRGDTTQLPGRFVVNTGQHRISRKIEVGGRTVAYENDFTV